jgi:hypothetical protein
VAALQEFGTGALVSRDGTQLSREERIKLGLEIPGDPRAFGLRKIDGITASRLRYALSELVALNIDNINVWIQQVAAQSPKAAIELMLELAQFSLPKLKAIAVQVDDRSANPRQMSVADLQKIIESGGE